MHVIHLLLPLVLIFSHCACATSSTAGSDSKPAQDSLFVVAFPVVAYILASEKDVATTYLVACPKDIGTTSCDFSQPYTLIQGPKTVKWSYAEAGDRSAQKVTLGCDVYGKSSMKCTATGTLGDGKVTSETLTYTGDKASALFRNVDLVTNSKALLTHGATKVGSSSTPCSTVSSTAHPTSHGYGTITISTKTTTERATITPPPVKESSLTAKTVALSSPSSLSSILKVVVILPVEGTPSHSPGSTHTSSPTGMSSSDFSPIFPISSSATSTSVSAPNAAQVPRVPVTANRAKKSFGGSVGMELIGGMAFLVVGVIHIAFI